MIALIAYKRVLKNHVLCALSVEVIGAESRFGVLGSNSSQARYVHFRANILKKYMNPSLLPMG